MTAIETPPGLDDDTRIYRQVTFDLHTFDLFMDFKRYYSAGWRTPVTNSEVLRALLLSHPEIDCQGG